MPKKELVTDYEKTPEELHFSVTIFVIASAGTPLR